MKFRVIAVTCAAFAFSIVAPACAAAAPNFAGEIPNIPGKSLIANEVSYAPGEASPAHTHGPSAFIYAYVISGAIESKVNDGETRVCR
jgi:quercetin dioxygenase-like cupin family protein